MKSLFDFIGRTETIEGLGAGARQFEKRKRLDQPRKALEGRPVKSLFDFIGRTETIEGLGAGARQYEKRKRLDQPRKALEG
jgi:hypothetical protein